ncbi:hypothetical protein [Streptomyces sp. NPDC018031]|uniref:hypothetical protein n=1 Tax=Streptomyces sp. NPDC018031 TaxID=3365033 RepID=UPI003790522F
MLRRLTVVLLGSLVLTGLFTSAATAAPNPILPSPESLITEGITIEGPLINNLGLPKLV